MFKKSLSYLLPVLFVSCPSTPSVPRAFQSHIFRCSSLYRRRRSNWYRHGFGPTNSDPGVCLPRNEWKCFSTPVANSRFAVLVWSCLCSYCRIVRRIPLSWGGGTQRDPLTTCVSSVKAEKITLLKRINEVD